MSDMRDDWEMVQSDSKVENVTHAESLELKHSSVAPLDLTESNASRPPATTSKKGARAIHKGHARALPTSDSSESEQSEDDSDKEGDGDDKSKGAEPASDEAASNDSNMSYKELLQICFLMDTTGSMQPYIKAAVGATKTTARFIKKQRNAHVDITFGLVAFKDLCDQHVDFVVKRHDFTEDLSEFEGWLNKLEAGGGGDAPEALASAMQIAHDRMSWAPIVRRTYDESDEFLPCVANSPDDVSEDIQQATGDAPSPFSQYKRISRTVVIITDAAPHGVGEIGDSYPEGEVIWHQGQQAPYNPIDAANALMKKGVSLYTVFAEPANGKGSIIAKNFYRRIASMTQGKALLLPHGDVTSISHNLAELIGGSAAHDLECDDLEEKVIKEMERLCAEGKTREEATDMAMRSIENADLQYVVNEAGNEAEIDSSTFGLYRSLSTMEEMREAARKYHAAPPITRSMAVEPKTEMKPHVHWETKDASDDELPAWDATGKPEYRSLAAAPAFMDGDEVPFYRSLGTSAAEGEPRLKRTKIPMAPPPSPMHTLSAPPTVQRVCSVRQKISGTTLERIRNRVTMVEA